MATDIASLLGAPAAPGQSPFAGPGAMPASVPTPGLPVPATVPPQPFQGFGGIGGLLGMMDGYGQPPAPPTPPIDKLRPDSDLHGKVRVKLDAMLKFSRDAMKKHYSRWNLNELKVQAYTSQEDYDHITQRMRDAGKGSRPPEPISVVVPYTYATLHAAATFIATVLLGRKPIFPLMATRGTEVERARRMEAALQSHLDASRGYETLWQGIWDSLLYGFGPQRITWEERNGARIRWVNGQREQSTGLTFAGNVLDAIDPYKFFPDPRVPISECNVKGDFIFTEGDISETVLRDMERAGSMKWVKEALSRGAERYRETDTVRQVRLGIGSGGLIVPQNVVGFRPMMEGTVRLSPKAWGLGDQEDSELWKFSWFENGQIMQAEPLGMIHGQHPFTAAEPTSFGHDFMSLSMADMIGNFQDILSWLVSSRMENVRAVVQNSFAVDPARIDVNDIRSSAIGRIIRLKQTAMGLPVKEAIMQIMVQDVTAAHMGDMQNMRILADTITGVNDNMRGIQTAGGRRSATEARIAMQNGGGRLSQHAVRISSQSYHPMCSQMISNTQQFMPDEMWIEQTGDDGQMSSNKMTPEMLVGDFNYQISDGTLPFDKGALVEVWKEILMGVAQDPELRQEFSLAKIFRYTAELGGAKNIDSFQRQQPPAMPMMGQAAPDPATMPGMVPAGPAMPQMPLMLGGGGM